MLYLNLSEVLFEGVLIVPLIVVPFAWTVGSFGGGIDEGVHLGGFHDAYESFDGDVELLEVTVYQALQVEPEGVCVFVLIH